MAEILLGGKRLSELKVTELKEELDSRGLSKKGVKTVLVTRLKNAILKEELESNTNNVDTSQAEEQTADSSMDQSQLEDSVTASPSSSAAVTMETLPASDLEQQMEDPLASTPTAAATTDTELANQLVDEQSHDTPATLPSDGASLEERDTPVMDDSLNRLDFIPLGGFDESMEGEGQEGGVAPEELSTDRANTSAEAECRGSVSIDPSYAPEGEELLYEGDVDEGTGKEGAAEGTKDGVKDVEETKEEGFIVHLHDTSMELEFASNKKPANSVAAGSDKESSKASLSSSECHLWVKGLSPSVRALDLQTLFSTFGKVVTAKVVAKAQSRNQRFGYVTMTTNDEAQKCISELNDTELKGRKITVEVAKNPPALGSGPSSKAPPTSSTLATKESKSPRLVRKTQDKEQDVKPARKSLESGTARKSPKLPIRSRSRSRERPRVRRRSPPPPRRSPPHRSPPMRRSPPRRFRSPSPPFREPVRNRLGPRPPVPADRREVSMRRDMERDRRLSEEHMLRESQRQVEMRLQERREREQEMAMRRRVEVERARQQQEMERRVAELREREGREREARERQAAERERLFRERERELREREVRERQRRETLEKQLREREMREQEFREREKRMKEAWERELQSKEMKVMREKEREARMQTERERELRERERKLKEDSDRIEAARRLQREEAAKLAREREEMERERKASEEKKRKQEEELRAKREEEKRSAARAQSSANQRAPPTSTRVPPPSSRAPPTAGGRLGKRSYEDSNVDAASKRPSLDDGGYPGSQGNSVFGRLDPIPKREAGGSQGDMYRRGGNEGFNRRGGYSGGLRYGNQGRGGSYQQSTSQSHPAAAMFGKPPLVSSPASRKPEGMSLAGVTPEVMTAAAQVLQNINKQVGLRNLPLTNPNPQLNVASQLHQIAAANPISQGYGNVPPFGGGGFGEGFMGGNKKLPPEEDRYNRRVGGRSGQYGMMRGNLFKGGRM